MKKYSYIPGFLREIKFLFMQLNIISDRFVLQG